MIKILFLILVWLTIGYLTARFAESRGRSVTTWFFLGVFFGLLALVALFILPPLNAEVKKAPAQNVAPDVEISEPEKDLDVEWFYLDRENNQKGPVDLQDLRFAWHDGVVNEESYVWCEEMNNWETIKQNRLLMAHLVHSPAE